MQACPSITRPLSCALLLLVLGACSGDTTPTAPPPETPATTPPPTATAANPGGGEAGGDEDEAADGPDGRWRRARPTATSTEEQLEAIGYLEGYEKAPEKTGIMLHEAGKTAGGYNFYVSGHGSEATLIDMQGKVLHTWRYDFAQAFPEITSFNEDNGHQYWRRAHLYPSGDILAIHEGLGIIKLDKDSNLLWARANGAHHHMQVLPSGEIYLLTRTLEKKRAGFQKPVWEDAVTVLSPAGDEVRRISILQAVLDSELPELKAALGEKGDLLHTNSIQVIDSSMAGLLPAFKEGNILLSSRKTDLVMVLDPDAGKIVWAKGGSWQKQHDAFFLDRDSLMIFDNGDRKKKASTVLVIHPETGAEQWAYRGDGKGRFFTQSCGANQRLPDGHTLIVESNFGRAFEVDASGSIVWEFLSPHRAGDQNELIATLFDMDRIPADFPVSWAKGG